MGWGAMRPESAELARQEEQGLESQAGSQV